MNILMIGHSGSTGYPYLVKMADKLMEKGSKVFFAVDNAYYPRASYVDLKGYHVYYFDQWMADHREQNIQEPMAGYPMEASYINYERFKCVGAKRSLRNFTKSVSDGLLEKMFYFFDDIITREKIGCILYETVSSTLSYMAYHMAQKRHILYIGWMISRIPGRYDLLTDPFGNIEQLKNIFLSIKIEDICEDELQDIRGYLSDIDNIRPSYMNHNPTNMRINYFFQYLTKLCWMRYKLLRQVKVIYLKKKFGDTDLKERYYLFPLHYQPEASTAVNAPFYCEQGEVIKNIAFSLPPGTKLYVKDHPNGIGFMSLATYQKIFDLPNVIYIDPGADTKRLICHSIGIVTITSTMGYEALLMKRPVLTLGKVFYAYHPYCTHIKGYEGLAEELRSMIDRKYPNFEEINIRFVKAYRDKNFEGVLLSEKDGDIDNVAESILRLAGQGDFGEMMHEDHD